jgi:hypothetical protein
MDDRGYYFWSYNHNPQDTMEVIDVGWHEITGLLNKIQGRTLLIIDTCNAAALVRPGTRGVRPDELSQLVKQASAPGLTLMVYAASAPDESAREGPQYGGGHGALTAAVLDALTSDKTRRNQTVTTKDMADRVASEVRQTTNDAQRVYADLTPLNARHFEFFRLP